MSGGRLTLFLKATLSGLKFAPFEIDAPPGAPHDSLHSAYDLTPMGAVLAAWPALRGVDAREIAADEEATIARQAEALLRGAAR